MAQASKSRLKVPSALFEFVVNGDEVSSDSGK